LQRASTPQTKTGGRKIMSKWLMDRESAISALQGYGTDDIGSLPNLAWAQLAREFLAHPDGHAAEQRRKDRFWGRMR